MRPRSAQGDVFLQFLDMAAERIPEIHIAVLVNVPVLPRLKNERMCSMHRLCQIYQNALPIMLRRVRNQYPQVVNTHGRTPDKRIPDVHPDQSVWRAAFAL
jgi:hypothetical protein